jgi:PEP-CTERM motif
LHSPPAADYNRGKSATGQSGGEKERITLFRSQQSFPGCATMPGGKIMFFSEVRVLLVSGLYLCASALIAHAAPFNTVINVPPEPDPGFIDSDTQLNLSDGGVLGDNFEAGGPDEPSTNVEVNIIGGHVGRTFAAYSGSTVNIIGGNIGQSFWAFSGSTVNIQGGVFADEYLTGHSIRAESGSVLNISGGALGRNLIVKSGGELNISGGEFFLDGVPIQGMDTIGATININIPDDSRLTATLSDGSTHTFSSLLNYRIADGTLSLVRTPLPTLTTSVIDVPTNPAPQGLRNGQTLNLNSGGRLGHNFTAFKSTVNVTGGFIGDGFIAETGSTLNIEGGDWGGVLTTYSGSSVNIKGTEFYLNGAPLSGIDNQGDSAGINIPLGSRLTAVLADGSVRSFGFERDDVIADGTLNLIRTSPLPLSSEVFNLPLDAAPAGLRHGQTLNVGPGGIVRDYFTAVGATVNIEGGTVGNKFLAEKGTVVNISSGKFTSLITHDSTLNITGGEVGDQGRGLSAYSSTVNISGGFIHNNSGASGNSIVNVSGGTVGSGFMTRNSTTMYISGGEVQDLNAVQDSNIFITGGRVGGFNLLSGTARIEGGQVYGNLTTFTGSELYLTGGELSGDLVVSTGSIIHLTGTSFILDGLDLTPQLIPGEEVLITEQGVTIEGLLADGLPFSFDIVTNTSTFLPDTVLTITLIPEPATLGLIGIGALAVLRRRMD